MLCRYNLKAKSKVKVKKRHVPAASHRQPTGDDDCHSTMSYSTRGARVSAPPNMSLEYLKPPTLAGPQSKQSPVAAD